MGNVLEVHALLLFQVVRKIVLAGAVNVVAAVMLVLVGRDESKAVYEDASYSLFVKDALTFVCAIIRVSLTLEGRGSHGYRSV